MRKRFLAPTVAAAALALTLGLAGCGGSDGQATGSDGTTTLDVGIIGIGSDAAITMAQQKGWFKDAGLDVKTQVVANPAAGIAAAQSGQLDLTYTPSIPYVTALSRKVPLSIVAAADGYPDSAAQKAKTDPLSVDDTGVWVNPSAGITRPKDLAGKKVSIPARKAQLEVTIAAAVRQDGGDPSTIDWMVLDPNSAVQSLEAGRVDASGLVAPFTVKAKSGGMKWLASPGVDFFGTGAVGLWVAGASSVKSETPALQKFQQVMVKANAYANQHYPEAEQVAADLTKIPLKTVEQSATTYWPAEVRAKDIQHVADQLLQLGYITQEVTIDDSDFLPAAK